MTGKIQVFQFARGLGLPNPSPFCMKLEGFLKAARIDYDVEVQNDPRTAPMGKLPYIRHNNETIADSNLVISYLNEAFNVDLDAQLSLEEKAIHHAMRAMLDEKIYFVLLYSRWAEDESWEQLRDRLFAPIPKLIRKLIANRIREGVLGDLKSQGIGRHSRENIYKMGCEDIQSLSAYLGDKSWFGGKTPCLLDITAISYLANFCAPELENPVKSFIEADGNLYKYTKRGIEQIYGEEYTL